MVPLPGVLAVLLFNMTMPVTLWAMAKLFPGAKGFSFGLLTFGLFLGYLPVYFKIGSLHNPYLMAFFTLLSLLLLCIGLRKARLWNCCRLVESFFRAVHAILNEILLWEKLLQLRFSARKTPHFRENQYLCFEKGEQNASLLIIPIRTILPQYTVSMHTATNRFNIF